jgi:hypothetical protein
VDKDTPSPPPTSSLTLPLPPDTSGPLPACLATLLCRPSTFTFRDCVKLQAGRRLQARLVPRLRVLVSNERLNSNEVFTKPKALIQNVDIATHWHLCPHTITTTTFGSTGLCRRARIGHTHARSCLSKSRVNKLTTRIYIAMYDMQSQWIRSSSHPLLCSLRANRSRPTTVFQGFTTEDRITLKLRLECYTYTCLTPSRYQAVPSSLS